MQAARWPSTDPRSLERARDDLLRKQLAALIRAGRGQSIHAIVDEEVSAALRYGRTVSIGVLCRLLMRSTGAWPSAAFGTDPGPLPARLQSAEPLVAGDPPTRCSAAWRRPRTCPPMSMRSSGTHGWLTMVCLTLGDMEVAAEHCRLRTAGSDALREQVEIYFG